MMSDIERIYHYGSAHIDNDDIDAIVDVLRSRWLTTGPKIDEFEKIFSEFCGCEDTVVCANGTAALYLACKGLELDPGDSVIVPSITFLATANAPRLASAEVIFSDVCSETGLMTPEHFEDALKRAGKDVRAVLPVHLNGRPCQMEEIENIASGQGIHVIEDACHALGGEYANGGSRVGSCNYSKMSTFSFHPVKNITMGEGGAITTNDPNLATILRELRNHGMKKKMSQHHKSEHSINYLDSLLYTMDCPSFNFRVSDIHCALGISQLKKLSKFVKKRQIIKDRYETRLSDFKPYIKVVAGPPGTVTAWHLCPLQIDFKNFKTTKNEVCTALARKNIRTQVHYFPVHKQPYYLDRYGDVTLPGSELYFQSSMSFPLYYGMEIDDVDYVCDQLLEILFH